MHEKIRTLKEKMMKKGSKRILSILLSLVMVFTSVDLQQNITKADDITWTKLSNLSIYDTYAYLNQADIDAGKFGNEGLRNFYDPGKGQGWNLADGSDMKNNIAYFGFVTKGSNATGLTIDGVEYPSDGQKVVFTGDTVYINQDLLKLQDNEDEHIFEIDAVGSNTQFQLRVKREEGPDQSNIDTSAWKEVPVKDGNDQSKYYISQVGFTDYINDAIYGVWADHTKSSYHAAKCTLNSQVMAFAIKNSGTMASVWVDGKKYRTGTENCYLDGDQFHLATSVFKMDEGKTEQIFAVSIVGTAATKTFAIKIVAGNEDTTDTTTAPSANVPNAPAGLVNASVGDLKYYFAWAPKAEGVDHFNVYVDETKVGEAQGNNYNLTDYAKNLKAGTHTFAITAVNEAGESSKTTIEFTVEGEEQESTDQQPSESYQESTKEVESTEGTTKDVESSQETTKDTESAPDITFDEVKEWKQIPNTAANGNTYYVSSDAYSSISKNGLVGLYDIHTQPNWHPANCTITGAVYVTAVTPVQNQMKAVWIDGVKYTSGTDVCYLDGDQCHIAQSLFTLPEGEEQHTFKVIIQGDTANYGYLMKVTSLSAPTKLNVYNYGKYTGKYFVEFIESKNAAGYNLYVDNTLIKNVKTSGYYITSEELEKAGIGNGQHTLKVTATDANGGESIEASSSFKVETKGTADDIPQIYISTHGKNVDGTYLSKKDDFLANANVAVIDNTGTYSDIIDAASDIKVRGNSTAGAQKKPWNFKLGKKQSVLGMDSSKKWSLLANAFDKSLIRNSLVMQLAAKMGLAYTSSCRFVDVYLNGEYQGNYVVIESVETGAGRVEINANDTTSNDILLELDNNGRDAGEVAHLERTELGVLFSMNEPELEPNDTEGIATYKNKIDNTQSLLAKFENALKADDYTEMSKYIDMESFAKFYIVNEFFRNQDFNFSSTRFYVKDGMLYAGPCWDYDLSSGNLGTYYVPDGKDTYSSFLCQEMVWYKYLMQNEKFKNLVTSIYKEYQSDIRAIFDGSRADQGYGIDGFEKLYKKSFERNFASKDDLGAGWSVTNPDEADAYSYANHKSWNTYDDAVEFLRTWLKNRHIWLEAQWGIDDPSLPASIVNNDGKVMIRWNNETGIVADHYNITYNKFISWDSSTYTATTESTTIIAAADLTQTEITDPIAAGSDVVVTAVSANGEETKVGTAVAKPDLIISDLYIDNEPVLAGAIANFKLKVSNIGTAVAYPSNDVVTSTLTVDGTGGMYTAGYKDAILPNATESQYGFQMNWTSTAGSHKVTAQIDERNKVDESNESNNTLTKTFVIDNTVERPTNVVVDITDRMPYVTITASEAQVEAGYTYNIYVDGIAVKTNVAAGTYALENVSAGTHTISVYSSYNGEVSVATDVKVEIPEEETTTETPTVPETTEATVHTKKVVAFNYSNAGKVAGDDVVEYADETNDYIYKSTSGTGTMEVSVTGTNLKHLEWSKDSYSKADGTVIGISPVVKASKSNHWSADAYAKYTFSTVGYADMTMSIDIGATNKGPSNFKIVYYDETNAEQILSEVHLEVANVIKTTTVAVPKALENKENAEIYVKLIDTTSLGGTDISAVENYTSGYWAINNFEVTVPSTEEETTAVPETTVPETTTEAPTEAPTYENIIAEFDYDGTGATAGTDMEQYAYTDNDYKYYATVGNGTMFGSVNGTDLKHFEWGDLADYGVVMPVIGASKSNATHHWTKDAYVAYSFSTKGHTGLKASVNVAGTKKGPANLAIGYYEGSEFKEITTYTLKKNKTIYTVAFDLPEQLQDKDDVTVYVKLANTTNIGGNDMSTDAYNNGGELAINNFKVVYITNEDTEVKIPKNVCNLKTDATFTSVNAMWNTPDGTTNNVYLYDEKGTLLNEQKSVSSYTYANLSANTKYQIKVTTVAGDAESAGVTTAFKTSGTTTDSKITGYQISTTLTIGDATNQVGIRTIYQTEDKVNGQSIKEFGLVIGLTSHLTDAENEMIANGTSQYVMANAATSAGEIPAKMGDSDTATYYARTMDIAGGYNVDYSVRTYAKLADGSIVYSGIKTVNVYEVAKELYNSGKMKNYSAHEALYDEIISKVDNTAQKVDYNWNDTLVNKPEKAEGDIKLEGYQMSANLGNVAGQLGLRIVYSVEGNYDEVGLVYGLVYGDNPITKEDMALDNDSPYVKSYAATETGKLDEQLGASTTATYYARTMNVSGLNKEGYTVSYMVRVYAKSNDGTITYSDVYTYNINEIASVLYDNDLMSTYDGHNAIYNNILTKVNADYKQIDFNWSNSIVK